MLTFVDMRAVVVRFYASRRVIGVDVKSVQMGTDILNRTKILDL